MAEPSIKCELCKVTVAVSKLAMSNRCCDHHCPLNSAETNAAHKADWQRSIGGLVAAEREKSPEPAKVPSVVSERLPPRREAATPPLNAPLGAVDNSGHGARVLADLAARKDARESEAHE